MVPAVAANVVAVDPAATVTEADTGRSELLLDKDTVVPPAGAAALNATVHVVDAPELTVVGLHTSEDSPTDGVRLIVAISGNPLGTAAEA
jgi:hypothetical protein